MRIRLHDDVTVGGILLASGTEVDMDTRKVDRLRNLGVRFTEVVVEAVAASVEEVVPSPSPAPAKRKAARKGGFFGRSKG